MRAIVTNGDGELREETHDRPEPAPDEALVKVRTVGICSSDVGLVEGEGPPWTNYPVVPGHEVCAEVVELGEDVDDFSVGDRVVLHGFLYCGTCPACRDGRYYQCDEVQEIGFSLAGGYREYAAFPAHTLTPISDDVTDVEACLVDPAACTLHALERIDVGLSDTAAVLGPGALGLFGVQLLRAMGVENVVLTGTRPAPLEAGTALGATRTVNVREEDPVAAIRDYTDGRGADVCVEAAGAGDVVDTCLKAAAKQGQIALTGIFAASKEIDPDDVVIKELSVVGGVTAANSVDDVIELFERGNLTVDPIVTHEFPLAEYDEAFETIRERRDGVIKTILRP